MVEERKLSRFEKYLTLWVLFCIGAGIFLGKIAPEVDEKDLSNAKNTSEFLKMFGEVVDNTTPYLEKGCYFALVIGDKYSQGEWIPLGFYCIQEVIKRGYLLKSIILKEACAKFNFLKRDN